MEHNYDQNQPNDGPNEQNTRPNDDSNDPNQPVYHSETLIFTGGPAFFASMQSFMNRIIRGQPLPQIPQNRQEQPEAQPDHPEQRGQSSTSNSSDDTDMNPAGGPLNPDIEISVPPAVLPHTDPGVQSAPPSLPRPNTSDHDFDMPPLEPVSGDNMLPPARPIRPLPRPHQHFHAHTPGGIIDLVTFNITGPPPPPPPPGTATLTFNLGTEALAGFEAIFLGALQKDREPDSERAKILVRGMEVVPEGLVCRLERAGGVPGSQGDAGSAGCAVCWGPLLDEVEPHVHESVKQDDEKAKSATEEPVDDEFRGQIIALPCAHVYHAECLLPWFSRNTTCPTCRFDIDPQSLTWTPRPPPPPPTNAEPAENQTDNPPDGDPFRESNAAEAARLHAFFSALLRGVPPAQLPRENRDVPPPPESYAQPTQPAQPAQPIQPAQPAQPAQFASPSLPRGFGDVHVFAPAPAPAPRHFPQMHPQPTQPAQPAQPTQPAQFASPSLPQGFGDFHVFAPAPAPAPRHFPQMHPFPPFIRMPMPFLVFPSGSPTPSQDGPDGPSTFQLPLPHQHPAFPPIFAHGPGFRPGHVQPPPPPPRREREKWTAPEPVGRTLRQRVETKERELGLRCDDMICGLAPSDEDPMPIALQSEAGTKRIQIRAAYDGHGKACEHSFHPACLVTSARVAGAEEHPRDLEEDEIQVGCPVCRAVGSLPRSEWEEGARASAELS